MRGIQEFYEGVSVRYPYKFKVVYWLSILGAEKESVTTCSNSFYATWLTQYSEYCTLIYYTTENSLYSILYTIQTRKWKEQITIEAKAHMWELVIFAPIISLV